MKKWLLAGTALLLIQITAAIVLNLTARDFGAFEPQLELLKFAPADIDGITIIGPEKEITLNRQKGNWFMAGYFNAPADKNQITALLKKLASLKQGLVVATSEGAAKRFRVSEEDFERHVILRNGDSIIADFFIGTSPGFKKVHARVHDRRDVVSVLLNNYDLEADFEKWLDQKMLWEEEDAITGLTMDDIKLSRKGDHWLLPDLADKVEIDVDQVKKLLSKIGNLRVKAIMDPTDNSSLFESEPDLLFDITLKDNHERRYLFAKPAGKDYSVLKSSDHDYLFKVDSWQADEIGKFDKNALVKAKAEDQP